MHLALGRVQCRLSQQSGKSLCTFRVEPKMHFNTISNLFGSSCFFSCAAVMGQISPLLSSRRYVSNKSLSFSVAAQARFTAHTTTSRGCNNRMKSIFRGGKSCSMKSTLFASALLTSCMWQHSSSSHLYPSSTASPPRYDPHATTPGYSSFFCPKEESYSENMASCAQYSLPPPPPQWMLNYTPASFQNPGGMHKPDKSGPAHLFSSHLSPANSSASSSSPLGSARNPVFMTMEKQSMFSRVLTFVISVFFFVLLLHFMQEFIFGSSLSMMGSGEADESNPVVSNIMQSFSPKPVNLDTLEVSFSTIRGCDEAKEELEDLVAFLKEPNRFTSLGGRLPKGFLLVGPPGCGKTLLAKAIAKEAGVTFFYASGSEFDEMFVGVGPRRIRELFAAAKKEGPSVIFIDEIDAIGMKRNNLDHGSSRMSLNQLLSEMDGFQSSSSVVVIAATNTPQILDKALLRPGRFDTIVSVDPPDMKGRTEVLQLYLGKVKADESVVAEEIARGTTGFTGAELSNLVNMSAIRAATLNRDSVTASDVDYAKDRIMIGSESKKIIPESEKKIIAYHEGAHALAAILLQSEGTDPVHKATIIPRGSGVLGLVQQLPVGDTYSQSKRQYLARIKVCLAGRIGEEMLLGEGNVTSGASSDFQKASEMARSMVKNFGFSDRLGVVFFDSKSSPEGSYLSDETKKRIDEEVQSLVLNAYGDAQKLLKSNKEKLELIANGLLERETLTGDELIKICAGETLSPAIAKPARQVFPSSHEPFSNKGPFPQPPTSTIPVDSRSVPIA